MTNESSQQASSHNIHSTEEKSELKGLYHKLDIEQDKILQRWVNWSGGKVIGGFTLSVIYSMVALFFILFFTFNSFLNEQSTHAEFLLVFAIMTACNLVYLIIRKNNRVSNSLVVLLMGGLCIYLYITGGVNQTGPLWYFVYPIVALFILNPWEGLLMTVLLFWVTMAIYSFQVVHFDYDPYPGSFMSRFFAVYIAITIMSFFYAYNRSKNDLLHREKN